MQILKNFIYVFIRIYNRIKRKDAKSIFFFPHTNCMFDGYDILNGESDNVLCLVNSILRDEKFDEYQLFILYYHRERLQSYMDFCKDYHPQRIHFVHIDDKLQCVKAISKCYTIFTDSDYTRVFYKVSTQRVVCLNYFGGLIKNEFYRWEKHGGFKKMLHEQKIMYRLFDYHLSISDISSKFIALDNCHYYSRFLPLGFPRNDVFFEDHSELRNQVESLVDFKVNRIITYVPTHRDYENSKREFFDRENLKIRSIWGGVNEDELLKFENVLAETNTLIIAKVHPVQLAQTSVISSETTKHVLFYNKLAEKIRTSLNPLLAISDCIITDYTTTVYDFLYTGRPIIYYFYDIERYRETRGFFIEPIESVCAGSITYTFQDLQNAIKNLVSGDDPYVQKRKFLCDLFIKERDGYSSERIKKFFFD